MDAEVIKLKGEGENDIENRFGHWILWGSITFFSIVEQGLDFGLCWLAHVKFRLVKVEKPLSHSGVDIPWLKGSKFRKKIRYRLKVCIWELAGIRIVEAMYIVGIASLKIKMKIFLKMTKSDHCGGHRHHTSIELVVQGWVHWVEGKEEPWPSRSYWSPCRVIIRLCCWLPTMLSWAPETVFPKCQFPFSHQALWDITYKDWCPHRPKSQVRGRETVSMCTLPWGFVCRCSFFFSLVFKNQSVITILL